MPNQIGPEASALAATAIFTGLIWIPIIANRLAEMGIWPALKNPEPDARPRASWAYRLGHAHRNALENLGVFAPLVVLVILSGKTDNGTANWAWVFFGARLSHAVIYAFGVPVLRTIAFAIGFCAQAYFAARLFGLI